MGGRPPVGSEKRGGCESDEEGFLLFCYHPHSPSHTTHRERLARVVAGGVALVGVAVAGIDVDELAPVLVGGGREGRVSVGSEKKKPSWPRRPARRWRARPLTRAPPASRIRPPCGAGVHRCCPLATPIGAPACGRGGRARAPTTPARCPRGVQRGAAPARFLPLPTQPSLTSTTRHTGAPQSWPATSQTGLSTASTRAG